MNEAIFINYQKSKQLEKIKELQREILNAERIIEIEIGKVVILDEGGKYKMSLEIDEDLLKACCETIVTNSYELEKAYRELKENLA